MSRHSAKSSGRSTKVARAAAAKAAKKTSKAVRSSTSVRAAAKKATKSATARRTTAKAARSTPAAVARMPRAMPEVSARVIRTASPPAQPTAPEPVSRAHTYQVGEAVFYTSPTFGRAAATGSYTVVKLLPSEGDDYQYRIKSSGEAFERVAKESQLDRA